MNEQLIGAIKKLRAAFEEPCGFGDTLIKEVERLADAVSELNAETVQTVVSPSEVKKYLDNGWSFISEFGDGNYVVVEHKE